MTAATCDIDVIVKGVSYVHALDMSCGDCMLALNKKFLAGRNFLMLSPSEKVVLCLLHYPHMS